MKAWLVALGSGLLFGSGLVVSGMTDPHRVKAFLTLGSGWDPALLWVMGGAVTVHALVLRVVARRTPSIQPAVASLKIDPSLVVGAAVFGVGWGFSGYCPGPVFVGVGARHGSAIVFFIAMMAGIAAYRLLFARAVEGVTHTPRSELPPAHKSTITDT